MDWTQIATIGGITFVVQVVSTICNHIIMRRDNQDLREKVGEQANELRQLKEEKLTALSGRVDEIESSQKCAVHEINIAEMKKRLEHAENVHAEVVAVKADVRNMTGWMSKVDSKLDMVASKVSRIEGKLEG